jgi:hypothetical protein
MSSAPCLPNNRTNSSNYKSRSQDEFERLFNEPRHWPGYNEEDFVHVIRVGRNEEIHDTLKEAKRVWEKRWVALRDDSQA